MKQWIKSTALHSKLVFNLHNSTNFFRPDPDFSFLSVNFICVQIKRTTEKNQINKNSNELTRKPCTNYEQKII